jgi:selenium metabolism protein YedF
MRDICTVDARGLACPQPVLETKKVLDEGQSKDFLVLVDNPTSRENVARFARNQGCEVEVRDGEAGQFEIRVAVTDAPKAAEVQEELLACPVPETAPQGKIVVYVGKKCMGSGDDILGAKLMRGFLRTWIDVTPLPWRVIFINSGVELTTTDEEAVDAVSMLEQRGVEILSCGTCLEHFELHDQLKVGKATNMYEVIDSLSAAAKVISPD